MSDTAGNAIQKYWRHLQLLTHMKVFFQSSVHLHTNKH